MRQLVSIPVVLVSLAIGLPLAPVIFAVSALADILRRRSALPTVRLVSLLYQLAVLEFVSIVVAGVLWVGFGFGLALRSAASLRVHGRFQWWLLGQVVGAARRGAHLQYDIEERATPRPGPLVVLSRHASYADSVLPAWFLGTTHRMNLRYVLADELAWLPTFGIHGRRLPNVFVNRRATDHDGELRRIRALGADLGANDAVVIFPEGQFPTPARRERAVARIATTSPEFAARAEGLRHVLPPHPAGTLALLDAAGTADIMVVAHVGLELFASVAGVARNLPLARPSRVTMWRIPASEIPVGDEMRTEWLWQQWERLDAWIDQVTGNTTPTRAASAE